MSKEVDRSQIVHMVSHMLKVWREDGASYVVPPSSKDVQVAEQITYLVERALSPDELEYAIEETKIGVGAVILDNQWTPYLDNAIATKERLERFHRDNYVALTGKEFYSYKVVKRPKALPYVEVENV